MSAFINDKFQRLWSLIRTTQTRTAEVRAEAASSGTDTGRPQEPQLTAVSSSEQAGPLQPPPNAARRVSEIFDSYYAGSVDEEKGLEILPDLPKAFPKVTLPKKQGKLDRAKKCFISVKNSVCITFFFFWASTVTLVSIMGASFIFFIPDFLRKEANIKKDVVLVTNAGRGLGKRLAIVLGLKAALVICWDPDKERYMNTVYDIRHRGGRAVGFTVDVSDETAVKNAAEVVTREIGPPDFVVMSAGRRPQRPLLHWSSDDLEDLFRINVTPHLMLLRTFLPHMISKNYGYIVSVLSASAFVPCSYDAPYAATKLGVSALMRGLADELDMHPSNKIRLACVYPYHTDRRPSLACIAKVVVRRVLKGHRSVVVPKCSIFWTNLFQTLPAPARRRWRALMSRLSFLDKGDTKFIERACPWKETCPRHAHSMPLQGAYEEGFIKFAPHEMASITSFDNLPLVLKKRQKNKFTENKDAEA